MEFGPTGAELVRVFRLPVGCVLIGVLLLLMGVLPEGSKLNGGTVVGVALIALSVVLGAMEWHDLERSVISWDGSGLTMQRRRHAPIRLAWDEVLDVRLHEITPAGRTLPGGSRLFLTVRPLDLGATEAAQDCSAYVDLRLGDASLGVPVSEGERRRRHLDEALKGRELPHYRGCVTTTYEDTRRGLGGLSQRGRTTGLGRR